MKMNHLRKKLALNSLYYVLCDGFVKLIPFVLMPVVASYLTVEQYGEVALFQTGVEIATIFVVFGTHHFYRHEYFKNNHLDFELKLASITISVVTSVSMFFVMLFLVLLGKISFSLMVVSIVAFFQSVISLVICSFQNREMPFSIAKLSASQSLINLLLSCLLLHYGFAVEARIIAITIASLIVGLYSLKIISQKRTAFTLQGVKYLVRKGATFGATCLPISISWWLRNGSDRLIVEFALGSVAVGVLSITSQFSLIFVIIGTGINNAVMPVLFRLVNQQRSVLRIIGSIICVLFFAVIFFIYSLPLLIEVLLPTSYHKAINYVELALYSSFGYVVFLIISNVLIAKGMSKELSIISVLSSLLHFSASLFLVNKYGVNGVFFSGIGSYSIGMILILLCLKYKSEPYEK